MPVVVAHMPHLVFKLWVANPFSRGDGSGQEARKPGCCPHLQHRCKTRAHHWCSPASPGPVPSPRELERDNSCEAFPEGKATLLFGKVAIAAIQVLNQSVRWCFSFWVGYSITFLVLILATKLKPAFKIGNLKKNRNSDCR